MVYTLTLTPETLHTLDLSPATAVLEPLIAAGNLPKQDLNLRFEVEYPREPTDPRELSEIPAVRLWFIRLDSLYPWLPFVLDWEAGELGRYTAMLVPHQFSPTDGIRYNPEALEIFVMHKIFVITRWLQQQGQVNVTRVKFMTQMLGYDIEEGLFDLLQQSA
ncbi:CRR6 family NdhI maturation factor [Halomicronema hongdechloris]